MSSHSLDQDRHSKPRVNPKTNTKAKIRRLLHMSTLLPCCMKITKQKNSSSPEWSNNSLKHKDTSRLRSTNC